MVVNPRLKSIWVRISAPQVVLEEKLWKFNFLYFSILRLAQDVKCRVSIRSLRTAEILVASKDC